MKKIKKIWGKRRELWKKYQVVVWIEGIFLCIIAVCAGSLYWTEKNNQLANAQRIMQRIQTDIYEKATGGGTAKEVEQLAVEEIMDTVDAEGNVVYGINLEVYKKTGHIAGEINDKHLSCFWRTNTENGIESEWFPMEDYFSDEQISGFFNYYTENGSNIKGRKGCYIQQMTGFYYLEKFIPVEIVFADRDTEDETYMLQNAEKMERTGQSRLVYRLDNIKQDTLEYPDQTETGYFSLYIYKPPYNIYNKASQLVSGAGMEIIQGNIDNNYLSGDESLWEKQITGNKDFAGYSCAIYADAAAMVKISGHLRRVMLPILIFFQGLAVLIIYVYLYIKKKQGNLAAMRDTFINAIAHEMKTPAAVIKNSTECLQAGIHPEKQEHYIEMINKEADHMNGLLNSMLTYTRVTDAVYKIRKEEYSLVKMAEDVCRHYADAIERKQISLIWDKSESEQILCDIKLMEMVLDNFISNAVKFCISGGVIRISLVGKSIGIFNEGKELTEEELKHIWEPFYRGDKSRTCENGSSGMGLAISQAVLKLHGAEFGVKNVSEGVEFYFKMK